MRELLRNTTYIKQDDCKALKNVYNVNNIRLKVGQWVDVKDSTDQWLEAQILDIRGDNVLVHYLELGSSRNEWISITSSRIALFRTKTTQSPYNKFYSPSPNTKTNTNLVFTENRNFDNLDTFEELNTFVDTVRDRLMKILIEKDNIKSRKARNLGK